MTMGQVLSSVKAVSQSIADIAHTTQEQDAGIAQVSQAMSNLERVTQDNAAMVAHSATAAEGLRHQATRLEQSAAFFKLGGERDVRIADVDEPAAPIAPVAELRPTPALPRSPEHDEEWREF
jgi:hypothetical protein